MQINTHSVVWALAALASLRNLLDMQNLRLHLRPRESEFYQEPQITDMHI